MFTGIIEAKGTVTNIQDADGMRSIQVQTPTTWNLPRGASVAVDGICLTVTATRRGRFSADLMPETLRKTVAGSWQRGQVVNLERALRASARLNGHLTDGHVDARAVIVRRKTEGRSVVLSVRLSRAFQRNVTRHGSLALNGVSLTVARLQGAVATVALVPYTLAHTNLSLLRVGDEVNLETNHSGRATVRSNATRRVRKTA